MGRPRKYETAAERQAAYRSREGVKVIEVRIHAETADTLDRIAEALDVSRNEVVNAVIKLGLTNRDWFKLGLTGKRLPYAKNPGDEVE